jgi:hypothetical protein
MSAASPTAPRALGCHQDHGLALTKLSQRADPPLLRVVGEVRCWLV